MIQTWLRTARHYWQLTLLILTIVLGLGLQAGGTKVALHWFLAVAALGLAIPSVVTLYDDVRHGHFGIDILPLGGIITAVTLHQYWTAVVIVAMVALGELVTDYVHQRAQAEVAVLRAGAPGEAHVLRGRKLVDIAVSALQAGDKIVIQSGEVVPVDGVIIDGSGSFIEQLFSPDGSNTRHVKGDHIVGGSVLDTGSVTARCLSSADGSQYRQIIRMSSAAGSQAAPFARLAERYSLPFTVLAFAIGGAAWYISGSALRFLDVVVVATPGPLLLSAPTAFMAGMSRALQAGIIVRRGVILERLHDLKTIAFTKTGTVTKGEPTVDKIVALRGYKQADILSLAAGLSQASHQPLNQAIVTEATARRLTATRTKHVKEQAGHGLLAMVHGQEVVVGQPALLDRYDITVPSSARTKQPTLYVAVAGTLAGYIVFKDELRPGVKASLARLQRLGAEDLLLITEDTQTVARSFATSLGISEVRAEATPADTLHALAAVTNRPVAFIGDGVIDAPALTSADVGIALNAYGSVAAGESADVIILGDGMDLLAEAMALAHRTFRVATQGIVIGLLVTFGLMALFATGHLPVLLGAFLQGVVDVAVVCNALRAHYGQPVA